MTDETKLAVDLARYEIEHRRKKQWDIFTWTVTIYVSIIAGVIVLASKSELHLSNSSRFLMTSALFALVLYAAAWLRINIRAEEEAISRLGKLLSNSPISSPSTFVIGYVFVNVACGSAAVIILLLANVISTAKAVCP